MLIRPLLLTDVAFTETNLRYPFCITVALRLTNGPNPERLRRALGQLRHRHRHRMLNIGIERCKYA